ncbi:MAG: TonB family protein [Candidatus Omnitrophica bacterium]|nr:TonB family protein [Candidatus Omnitrophota bacterium]
MRKYYKFFTVLISCLFCLSLPCAAQRDFYDYLQEEETAGQVMVNNVFYETDVRQALQDISAQTEVPIVVGPSVEGFVSLELKNVPLEDALTMLLVPLGYSYKRVENYYIVGLAKPESPVFDMLAKTEVIRLSYIKAADAVELISEFFKPYVKANEYNNSVAITAPQNIIDRFKEDIRKIDHPRQQVMMEALVVEVSESGRKELGVEWGSMQEGGFSVSPPGDVEYTNYLGIGSQSDQYEVAGTVTRDTLLTLKTLIQTGRASIRANPRIAALDGEEASIFIGREEWFLINTGSQAYPYNTLQSIKTGVTLKITPNVSADGQITVKIQPEVSEVVGTQSAQQLPIVNSRNVSTTIRVTDGETIVIGGLRQQNTQTTERRTPGLGRLPLVGGLFRSDNMTSEDKEVLIFITPHLSPREIIELGNKTAATVDAPRGRASDQRMTVADLAVLSNSQREQVREYISLVRNVLSDARLNDLLLSVHDDSVRSRAVVIRFDVSQQGYVQRFEFLQPSGSPVVDRVIEEAVREASPFPPFPKTIGKKALTVRIPFYLQRR